MNRAEKVQHLRALADALERGRELVYDNPNDICPRTATLDGDGVPQMISNIWRYSVKPAPFECWVNVNESGQYAYLTEKHALSNAISTSRTIHMREVEE